MWQRAELVQLDSGIDQLRVGFEHSFGEYAARFFPHFDGLIEAQTAPAG